ncbi:hypothetical protein JRI60_36075 [Archangium violaceum]|uniref:hypothetical protein n=1 Tax=Archangium violaceum TaxID=83451 RepID=UPI0019525E9D|nr:hypothetical protein [Archangium violaceum]QRN94509.1 hypothetical protein JRI60_36075 [Archangium violaceum]
MDEKKKAEEKWEEAERLGPYQLHEQVPQSAGNQGELYRATHETSGATALVLKPAAEQGAAPVTDWRVQLSGGLVDTADAGESVLARPLPREPFKGQKRPPCTRYAEVELVGACWLPHELKAPCPDVLYEYQGKCYLPAFSAKPPPQSLGQ